MKCCTCGPTPTLIIIIIITSIFIMGIGIALKSFMPELIHQTIAKNLVVSTSSPTYEQWVKPPITLYSTYYFFNYTNANEFVDNWMNGTKPRVDQLGPYIYSVSIEKENITFYGEDEVEYYVRKIVEFVPELSNGTEKDILVFPNLVLRTAAYARPVEDASLTLGLLQMTSCKEFLQHTVGDLLFDGYVDEILVAIEMFTGMQLATDNKFHLLQRNTKDGPIRVKTGHSDINEIGTVVEYENQRKLDCWPEGSSCNEINGGEGTMFPPRLSPDKKLKIFIGAFCRTLPLHFLKEVEHYGLKANRFVLDKDALANTNPEYECFCQSEINYCRGAGVFNLGSCKDDAQIFLSMPHLLYTDYYIRNAIDGLAPDPDKHVFQFDLEKNTGLPVNVSVNVQLNLGVAPIPWMKELDTLPEIILPVLWMTEGISINESMAEFVNSKLKVALMAADMIPMAVLGLGGIFGMSGIICSIYYMFKMNKVTNTFQVQPFKDKAPMQAFTY